MNYIEYIKHSLFEPEIFNRRFESDLPEEESIENGCNYRSLQR